MPTNPDAERGTYINTSKVTLTIPDPDKCAPFIARALRSGGSTRVTIPADIIDLLSIRPNDILELTVTKRERKHKGDLIGGYEQA